MMIKITKRLPFLPLVFKQNFQTGYICIIAMSKHVIKKSKKAHIRATAIIMLILPQCFHVEF